MVSLPKSLFACLKTFFDKSKAHSRRFQKSPFKAHTVEIDYLPLYQDLLAQNALKTAQRNFYLGNNLSRLQFLPVSFQKSRL